MRAIKSSAAVTSGGMRSTVSEAMSERVWITSA